MPTNLYFVRHAHSTYTPDELARPLSSRGFADAERINGILEKENIDIVISSPYRRSVQTVEGVAKVIGQEVIIEDGFKERNLSAKPVEDFNLAITKVWEEPSFSWEGGESNIDAQKRGIEATLKVLETYEGKNIAVGTHGNIMVLIMNYFDEKYGFSFWKDLNMPDVYKLTFDKRDLKEVNRIWNR
ncbi:phosphoglycerate mutase [Bacillus sp. NRRL B-14911]|uniref:Phosphoglycerate mutase n=1 Tax=Bacillus infantis NRRL B-14911 TaxID=1367477 RepID=U5L5B7_9BACI|nr:MULTISPECIES: histidine phosphatase family protein [Bacillus]AGX02560.1 phosphoglycerate mutase [Bacillus infantis NRRL B-14911]EAR67322.1 phosphoglycerate mutase [Bacillus sp. NRRL B-14911]MDT0160879.1 histidine phosphatase family protein [Bacillus sp. AG4(2022)]